MNVCRRDNDIRVICSPGVTESRSLDDAGRDFPQSRDIRDAHLLVEECGVHDSVKSYTEVQGNDHDKLVDCGEVGDGV